MIITDVQDSKSVIQALRHGAHGVVPRRTTPELLTKSIHTVLDGGFWISRAMVADFVNIIRESGAAAKRPKTSDAEPTSSVNGTSQNGIAHAAVVSEADSARLGLTGEELHILSALTGGQAREDIAKTLGVNENIVKQQLTSIYSKLGVYNNLDLVLFGWIDEQLA